MNCRQANEQIKIVDFLREKGVEPLRTTGTNYVYLSPFRNEEKPSFFVDPEKNLWHDFGSNPPGGSLIDLVCLMFNVKPAQALHIVTGTRLTPPSLSFSRQKPSSEGLTITSTQDLTNPILIRYLESRKILLRIGRRYLKQATYTNQNKNYFALAFKNDLGGYVLRNGCFPYPLASHPAGITTIPAATDVLNIFEGFFDFLSCLVYCKSERLKGSSIILNSVSHLNKLFEVSEKYQNINIFLDNDTAGIRDAKRIQERHPKAVDQSKIIYPGFKDFNDFLTNKKATTL